MNKKRQSQGALTDQLHELMLLANKNLLYDAADFIREHLERGPSPLIADVTSFSEDEVIATIGMGPIKAAEKDGLQVTRFYVSGEAWSPGGRVLCADVTAPGEKKPGPAVWCPEIGAEGEWDLL